MEHELNQALKLLTDPKPTPADEPEIHPEAKQACSCCCERKKKRGEEEYRRLTNRLSRIEGQIRGIRGMLEKNAYCADILTQSAAVNAAMNAFGRELLAAHIRTCVADDIRAGRDETIDELLGILQKMMK